MTRKSFKRKEMKDFVCEYFVRVCKNHDMYHVFIKSFNNVMRTRGDRNPFGEFKNIFELSRRLDDFTEREYSKHARRNDDYERVTMMINHMLHFFLEKGGVDPRRLGMIGQEIFDLTCYGLYGDKYLKDMEGMKQNEPRAKNNKEATLLSEFMRLKKDPNFNVSWDDFLKTYLPQLDWMDDDIQYDEPIYDSECDEYFNEDEREMPW